MRFLVFGILFITGCAQAVEEKKPVVENTIAISADAEELFRINCSQCHRANKDFVAPALKNVRQRWNDHGKLYRFIRNSQEVIKEDAYARELFKKWNNAYMQPFPELTDEQIKAILDYADLQ